MYDYGFANGITIMKIQQSTYLAMLRDGIKEFQSALGGADVPLHTLLFFLSINEKTPPKVSDMAKLFPELSSASITRNGQILTGTSKTRKDRGFPLCEYVPDPKDKRISYLHLTAFGKALRHRIYTSGITPLQGKKN